jgi:hypothetical protein
MAHVPKFHMREEVATDLRTIFLASAWAEVRWPFCPISKESALKLKS